MMQTQEKQTIDILEQEKKAVEDIIAIKPITGDNAVFTRTEGGFVRMEIRRKNIFPRGGAPLFPLLRSRTLYLHP